MGSSKGNNTSTTTSSPNSDAMAAYQSLLARAGGVANTPYQAYGGELVAPMNQQQYGGVSGINQYAYSAQPAIQQAEGMATAAASPITAQQIQSYESPYTQQVVNATQAAFANQNAQQMQGVKGNAIAQGALGGNREAIAEAETANQQQMAQAPVIANLQNQGYQTGLNTALTEQQALASGAYSLGNLGVSGQSAGLTGANAQIGAGTLEQQNQQALDQALYGQFQQAQAFPYQQAQWLAGLTSGIGSQMGGTSSTTGPPPSWMSQLGGLGMAGMGLFGQSGAMSGLGSLGSSIGSGFGQLGQLGFNLLGGLSGFAARGGRIKPRGIAHFDSGGGVAGMPYADAGATPWASGAGWIPGGMQLGHGAGIPHPPAAPQPQSAADLTKQVGSLAKMLGPGGGNDSTFGGVNYNGVAGGSGLSGSDMAQAAQAGVASGLQFNPMTGEVMARGGAVGVARHGYADGGSPEGNGPDDLTMPPVQGFGDQPPSWWSQMMGPRAPAKSTGQIGPPNGFNVQGFGDDAPLPNPTTLAAAAGAPTEGVGPAAPDRPLGLPISGDLGAMASLPFVNTDAAPTAPSQRPSWMGDVDPSGSISARGDAPLTSGIAPVAGVSGAWAGPDVAAPGLPPATAIAAPPGGVAPSSMADFLRDRASGRAVSRAGDLKPDFATRLTAAIQDAEDATGHRAKVSDFGRTYEEQADAYRRYQTGEGGLAAPPGHSRHQIGEAADISRGPVLDWLHANAGKYGLEFLPGHSGQVDPVHIQLAKGSAPADSGVADNVTLPAHSEVVSGGRSNVIPNAHGVAPAESHAGIDWSSNGKLWPALTTAGFAMMASKSPFPGVAIGEGGLAGVGTYQGLQQQEANRDLKKSEIDLKVKQLAQQADIAQKHLDAQSRPFSERTVAQQDALHQHESEMQRKDAEMQLKRQADERAAMQPVKIGTREDDYGNRIDVMAIKDQKTGAFHPIDPTTGSVTAVSVPPAALPPAVAAAPEKTPAQQAANPSEPVLPVGLAPPPIPRNDDFLKQLEQKAPGTAATVKGLADYEIDPATMSIKGGHREQLIGLTRQFDPTYDQTLYPAKKKAVSEFYAGGPQSPAGTLTAGNTAILHAKDMSDAIEEMRAQPGILNAAGAANIPFVSYWANKMNNKAVEGTEAGVPLNKFMVARQRFSEEVTKFYSGSNGSQAEREHAIQLLDSAKSLPELRAAIAEDARLMKDKVAQMQNRLMTAMGPAAWRNAVTRDPQSVLIYQNSREALDAIERRGKGENVPAEAAAKPAAAPPTAVAGPAQPQEGERRQFKQGWGVYRGGKWVPEASTP